ncbi:hypothetical protein X735_11835 [Mesorhizobium sp. L2C085B000]|nr:hypothetical protein X764_29220 [Mesorhizobium sp. LSHC440A00]ESZ17770.1 hypothetical protein X735_11835 [Mesorhizobium sp. L2C085B000]
MGFGPLWIVMRFPSQHRDKYRAVEFLVERKVRVGLWQDLSQA